MIADVRRTMSCQNFQDSGQKMFRGCNFFLEIKIFELTVNAQKLFGEAFPCKI
jgi:hypothetical protein